MAKYRRLIVLVAFLTYLGIAGVWSVWTQAAPLAAKEQPVRVPKELAKRIKSLLPKGWTMVARGDTFIVRRLKPAQFYCPINQPAFPTKEAFLAYLRKHSPESKYELSLRFRPRVSHKEYAQLSAQNDQTSKRLEVMRDKLGHIPHKFDDYLPSTPEDKRLVREYQQAKAKLPRHRLPDMYSAQHSIYLTRVPVRGWEFVEEETGQECNKVADNIRVLFKPYRQGE
jgi:hypothetical protein